jgi:putative toxin-antitoxin system antitoxin component (TIGR02293 family)
VHTKLGYNANVARKTRQIDIEAAIFGTADSGTIHNLIAHGKIRSKALVLLRERLDIDRRELAAVLAMGERTLIRREDSGKALDTAEADRVYRVARIFKLATQMIGDEDKARRWIRGRIPALGGKVPLELLITEAGARQVEGVLYSIGYGGVA